MFLPYLQQDVMIINRNLLKDESLAPEKLCIAWFGGGRLKITIEHHTLAAYANIIQVTYACEPPNLRPQAGDCMRLD